MKDLGEIHNFSLPDLSSFNSECINSNHNLYNLLLSVSSALMNTGQMPQFSPHLLRTTEGVLPISWLGSGVPELSGGVMENWRRVLSFQMEKIWSLLKNNVVVAGVEGCWIGKVQDNLSKCITHKRLIQTTSIVTSII